MRCPGNQEVFVQVKRLSVLLAASLLFIATHLTAMAQEKKPQPERSVRSSTTINDSDNPNTMDYTTSWLGNSLPGNGSGAVHALRHVPLDIDGIFATPDGKVYTNTTWEEGGRPVSVFKDGKLISLLNDENNSPNWSNGGGTSIAADATHIFRSNTPNGTGVAILDAATLDGTSLNLSGSSTLNSSHGVEGMAISGGKLYLTQQDFNKVEVYDLATLSLTQTFSINNPVLIAVDPQGGFWVSHRDQTPYPSLNGNIYNYDYQLGLPTVDHYNSSGQWINSVSLPQGGEVGALWIDNLGFLLVGDNGPDENIKVYGNITRQPVLVTTLGVKGGIYAGNADERGKVGPWRFRGITGIATDRYENVYVSENGFAGFGHANGHGAVLESYNLFGLRNWSVNALEFVSTVDSDPKSEFDLYDPYHHFKVDYNRPTGSEAQYVADTYDPFRYPDDIRITGIPNTTQVQYIQGHKFLIVGNQGGVYMAIYRFDDSASGPGKEIAIPSVAFDYGSFQQSYQDFTVQPTDGEFIWRDLNGDGQMQMNEFVEPPNNLHRDGGDFWMDSNGDVWQVNYQGEYPPYENSIYLRRYLFQGFDSFGSPIYDFNHVKVYDAPTDFPGATTIQRVMFRPHESDGGTLYAATGSPSTGAFSQIMRYDNWDKGNRTAKWVINVPFDPDPNNSWIPNSFTETGDFLFLDFNVPHYTLIYSTKTGDYVGRFTPGDNVGGLPNVGNDDEWQSMRSFKLHSGEYVLLHEEDFQAKQLMYRWKPPASLVPPPQLEAPAVQSVVPGDETAQLTWNGGPTALVYNVSRSTVKGGPYTLVQSGVVGNTVTDQGLTNGKTYYYVVAALTETGLSPNSNEISVTPVSAGTTYEAESGVLQGGAQVYACTLCSGGLKVGSMVPGATIALSGITAPKTGNYAVRLYYGDGDSNTADIATINLLINGTTTIVSPTLPFTGDWSIPGYVSFNLPLNQGSNTIVLGNPATDPNGAPDIDRIVVPTSPN